jgi:hypothetical protein
LFYEAKNFIFSSIFSQTLGTPKKKVGLHSYNVSTRVPYKAVGSANHNVAPAQTVPITSTIYAAT